MARLKYLCKSFTTPITQSELFTEKKMDTYPVYGASVLAGYKNDYAVEESYLGIVKDGAGVGRINIYKGQSSLLGTLAYIVSNKNINISWLKYAIMALNLGENIESTTIPHIYFNQYGNRYVKKVDIINQKKLRIT